MEKGLVITTDGREYARSFGAPLYKTLGEVVGGWIEVVHPMNLPEPYRMIVNEEGLNLGLPMNAVGSWLYGTQHHGAEIVGDLVIMKEVWTDEGPDIGGLTDEELENLAAKYQKLFGLTWMAEKEGAE